jgi:CHAD domain-containing protein
MSYRLRDPDLASEVRRVAREQVDGALDGLGRSTEAEEGVHEARRRLKRLRALLRLLRGPLGDVYRMENRRYRDVGRALAGVRDAQVARDTFERVFSGSGSREIFELREMLGLDQTRAAARNPPMEERLPPLRRTLADGRREIDDWPLDTLGGFKDLQPGLVRTYRRGRRGLGDAADRGGPEDFHEWRKRVKYHREHMRLLQDTWKGPMKARRRSLGRLSDLLGEAHDLVVLRRWLEGVVDEQRTPPPDLEALSALDRRRRDLEIRALPLGRRLFAEKPRHLARRLRTSWKAWLEERSVGGEESTRRTT